MYPNAPKFRRPYDTVAAKHKLFLYLKPLPRFVNIYDTRAPELLGGSPGYRGAP